MPHHRRQAILAVQHVAHRPRAHRTHRLTAISAVPGCVHIYMDSTLHRVLPSNTARRAICSSHAELAADCKTKLSAGYEIEPAARDKAEFAGEEGNFLGQHLEL